MEMTLADHLNRRFPNRVVRPATISDIPKGVYLVYILAIDDLPVVVGHGKRNRARVIWHAASSADFKAAPMARASEKSGEGSKLGGTRMKTASAP